MSTLINSQILIGMKLNTPTFWIQYCPSCLFVGTRSTSHSGSTRICQEMPCERYTVTWFIPGGRGDTTLSRNNKLRSMDIADTKTSYPAMLHVCLDALSVVAQHLHKHIVRVCNTAQFEYEITEVEADNTRGGHIVCRGLEKEIRLDTPLR